MKEFFHCEMDKGPDNSSPFFQFHKLAYHTDNIDAVENLLYGSLGDQKLTGLQFTQ